LDLCSGFSFSALMLMVGRQEGRLACEKLLMVMVVIGQELCTC